MMNREKIERLIVDASDGVLSATEIEQLEEELVRHPDLNEDYRAIMKLPELADLYEAEVKTEHYQSSIQKIRDNIRNLSPVSESFEVVSLNWFRRYALAASIAIFAVTSVFSFIQSRHETSSSEEIIEELFYPIDDNLTADSYVLYLEDYFTKE